ncbi:hypothetical protein CFP56_009562 [Quercus suber]|uniref:AB hydrolase-1 domain-containing protein n=1 Tax=Quercus suber TaxID=58331 RepID=A0AAW0M519_QUESU
MMVSSSSPSSINQNLLVDWRSLHDNLIPINLTNFHPLKHDAVIAKTLSPEIVEELGIYVVSFDRPGYGESDPNPKRTVKSMALDIEELADQLGLGSKFYVIGFSMGGQVLWSCLKYIPHRVAGAGLLAPVVNYWWPGFPGNLSGEVYNQQLWQDQWAVRVAHYTPWLTYWWNTQKWFPSSSVAAHSTDILSPQDKELMAKFSGREKYMAQVRQQGEFESLHRDMIVGFGAWEFSPLDLENPFPNNEGSVHLWHGDEDWIVPVMLQRYIAQQLPWIHYHELPGAGHLFPHADGMSDTIIKAILTGGSSLARIIIFINCCAQVRQQGEFESLHRDMIVGFGAWEFSPLDLENPFPNNEGSVHLWHGDEDWIVPVMLQRYIAQQLPWIHYHELPGAGHLFPHADGMSDTIIKAILTGGSSLARMHDAVVAKRLSPEIVEDLRIYTVSFDRPGYGESDPNPKRTVKSMALDIEELADQLGLGSKFYVTGFSMGGQVLWSCLKYIPHRLAGAGLLAPAINYWWPGFPDNLSSEAYYQQLPQDQWAFRVAHYTPWLTHWWNTQKWFPASSIASLNLHILSSQDKELMAKRSERKKYVAQVRQQGEFESLHRDLNVGFGDWEFSPMDLENPFPNNEGSVHLWHGDEDLIVPVTLQRYIAQQLPWIHYHELPGTGHLFPHADGMCDSIIKAVLIGEK